MRSATIAAQATPVGTGGISVIRISGPDAIPIADKVFVSASGKSLSEMKGYTAAFGYFVENGVRFDEGVALVFIAPASFTGENVVELSCHGGVYVTQRLLNAVISAGARPAQPGEFTKRAFLNGKMDLSEAESVLNIIQASSEAALQSAFEDKNGRLSSTVREIKNSILHIISDIAAWIDYPDEDIPPPNGVADAIKQVEAELENLLAGYENVRILREGIHTAIIGKPNTGKSALMNRLAGVERSIVTDFAGTTRDVVEESIRLGDVILRLADTAGIRNTDDPVETIGVKKALQKIEDAELILAVFDGSRPLDDEDKNVISACNGKKAVALINKSDLPMNIEQSCITDNFQHVLMISAKTGEGVERIESSIKDLFFRQNTEQTAPFTIRQKDCVQRALSEIKEASAALHSLTLDVVQYSLESAASALMELTGESVTEKVLEQVFSRFCIGK